MTNFAEIVRQDNPVFQAYVFWSTILIMKMLAMSFLTGRLRFNKKVMANPEDVPLLKDPKVKAPKFDDEDVERVRRAHRNDLENCLPFFAVGFFYLLTSPTAWIAINLFRVAVIARIVHTIFYAIIHNHSVRGKAWVTCYLITGYMGIQTLIFFW